MSYASAQDMINRYPNRDLVQLTNEDPTVLTVDTAVLQQVLDDASAEIDGYLGGRFVLPLTDPPEVLNRLSTDIAMYRLQALRPVQDIADARQRYEDAIAMLTRVAAGEMTLGIATDGNATAASPSDQALQGPVRVFSRTTLKGF